jgi:hypothetical protein
LPCDDAGDYTIQIREKARKFATVLSSQALENILPAGRRRRLVIGAVLAALTLAVAVTLVVRAAGPAWFAIVFALAWLAALMLLQARDRT